MNRRSIRIWCPRRCEPPAFHASERRRQPELRIRVFDPHGQGDRRGYSLGQWIGSSRGFPQPESAQCDSHRLASATARDEAIWRPPWTLPRARAERASRGSMKPCGPLEVWPFLEGRRKRNITCLNYVSGPCAHPGTESRNLGFWSASRLRPFHSQAPRVRGPVLVNHALGDWHGFAAG
jgi:hypothetical protein